MEWLKYHPPTRENVSEIKTRVKATFNYRRAKIEKEAPPIGKILEDMPKFRDMPNLVSV